ncbi:hypothetical protein [Arsenophonus endosymbiont of Bemisia tabaci]|uniref:hypothetical protein n=1 Tax=Arsenophonus endosymbiont of Bemisia tabaci TaxID=536059 RepID=UPI0015F4D1BB|nr:hypothetical protein [Arsenophonus endosymbiont of Bemisia tabaci]
MLNNIQMLTKKSVQSILAFFRRPFGKALKKMRLTYKKLYVIRKPTKKLDKRFNKKQQYENSMKTV